MSATPASMVAAPPMSATPASMVAAPPAVAATLQHQIFLTQSELQALQQEMHGLVQKQVSLPDPNDAQKMQELQQRIFYVQLKFQTLFLEFSQTPATRLSVHPEASSNASVTSDPLHLSAAGGLSIAPQSTLNDMGFEEVVLPPGPPGSLKSFKPKPTKKPRSTKPTKKSPIEDAFAKMGTKAQRDKTDKPSTVTSGAAKSSDVDSLRAPLAYPSGVTNDMAGPPSTCSGGGSNNTASMFVTDTVSTSGAVDDQTSTSIVLNDTAGTSGAVDDVSGTFDNMAGTFGGLDTTLSPPTEDIVNNQDPLMQALFPGLQPFVPMDLTLEDVEVRPEDLIPFPDELQELLRAEEPLLDTHGGRPSSQTLNVVDAELASMDATLARLSKKTGISIANILKRWNTTKTRGSSLWNIYQRYFTANKDEELERIRLDPTTTVTGTVRSQAYVGFRKAFPETWPEVLDVWAQYKDLDNSNKSAQQRALAFRRAWRTICGIVSSSNYYGAHTL